MAIPQHEDPVLHQTLDAIRFYVLDGQRPGDFLYAFAADDLEGVMRSVDTVNSNSLVEIYEVFYNMAPSGCRGSEEAVQKWIDQGGVQKNYEQFEELFDGYEQEHYTPEMAV